LSAKYVQLLIMPDDPFEIWNSQNEFLLEIARQVDRLITNNPKNLYYFRENVRLFITKYEVLFGLKKQGNQEAPINPPYILAPLIEGGYPKQWQPQKQEDLLPDYCFLLAIIHDAMLPSPSFVPINNDIYSVEDSWVQSFWSYYGSLRGGGTIALIQTALEFVKNVIADKTDKRGRKPKYTVEKLKEVQASYKRHYEKTNDVKAAWNKAAKKHGIKSGKAAEMACRRRLNQNK